MISLTSLFSIRFVFNMKQSFPKSFVSRTLYSSRHLVCVLGTKPLILLGFVSVKLYFLDSEGKKHLAYELLDSFQVHLPCHACIVFFSFSWHSEAICFSVFFPFYIVYALVNLICLFFIFGMQISFSGKMYWCKILKVGLFQFIPHKMERGQRVFLSYFC